MITASKGGLKMTQTQTKVPPLTIEEMNREFYEELNREFDYSTKRAGMELFSAEQAARRVFHEAISKANARYNDRMDAVQFKYNTNLKCVMKARRD